MTHDEFREIVYTSVKNDWLYNDERGIYTLKNNLDVRIEKKEINHQLDKFSEQWATSHPDPVAYRVIYEIYFGASFVEEVLLVTVDGFRATLPLPIVNTLLINKEDYQFAKIVDHHNTLEEYIERSNLRIQA